MKEEKVCYAVTKYGKYDSFRFTGIGKIIGNDLVLKDNKVLDNSIKDCHPIPYKDNEYTGYYYEFNEVELTDRKGRINEIETETEYKIWFKKLGESKNV